MLYLKKDIHRKKPEKRISIICHKFIEKNTRSY